MLTYEYYKSNPEILNSYSSTELVPLNCYKCGKSYHKTRKRIKDSVFRYGHIKNSCSKECQVALYTVAELVPCALCYKPVLRQPAQISDTKRAFCNHSCSATYNNKHKQYGYRRSKLEIYLEDQLNILYPNLKIVANGKETINSELDFYFPELKFAVELNGPTHYEPIYGLEKLSQIQKNDKQKFKLCHEAGIELMIVDVSKVKHLTEKVKKHYLDIFCNIIEQLLAHDRVERS